MDMNFFRRSKPHKLVTEKVKNDIRARIKDEQLTPGYILVLYENSCSLLKCMTNEDFDYALNEGMQRIYFPAFVVEEDHFSEDLENNKFTRHITKVRSLIDVSPVTYPAYEEASVSARSFESWKESRNQEEVQPEQVEDYTLQIKELDLMVLDGPLTDESDDSNHVEIDTNTTIVNQES